jgi:hypothetical protein
MIIGKNDNSKLRYEKDLQSFTVKPGHVLKARSRARYRQMYLHGKILTEDSRLVELKTDDYLMNIYTLYLEESVNGIVTNQVELLCGLNAHDVIESWKMIRRYDYLPFSDIESVLEDEGYPDIEAFDKKCKAGLSNYARYNNIIKRNNFDTTLVELTEAREIEIKK